MHKGLLYAGIGSRETPGDVLHVMSRLGSDLAKRGYILRSGAAQGADSAFEYGCDSVQGTKEIWLPWEGFNGRPISPYTPKPAHYQRASELHPAWERLTRGPKSLHARNVGQVLGDNLDTPVSFVVCWTLDGAQSHSEISRTTGGTGTAIRLASLEGIPVFNLRHIDCLDRLRGHVRTLVV